MIYQSDELTVKRLDGDIAELNFDLQGESVNKFDQATVTSLTAALDALEAESGLKGLLVTSSPLMPVSASSASSAAVKLVTVAWSNLLTDSPCRSKFSSAISPSRRLIVSCSLW